MRLEIRVHGTPTPQGSKRHVGNGIMVESSKALPAWREAVKQAALDAMRGGHAVWTQPPRGTPIELHATFIFPRPASHYGTGRNAGKLKSGAGYLKPTAPDLSKLVRGVEDALTDAGVWADDAMVASLSARKRYALEGCETPGAVLAVSSAVWERVAS